MFISILPYLAIFGVRMGVSNIIIRRKDYEHTFIRGMFYLLGVLAVILSVRLTMPVEKIVSILHPRTDIWHRGWFIIFIIANTFAYKQALKFSITRKSSTIPSMFLAPRSNFLYTKYIEILFQQACFIGIIVGIQISTTISIIMTATIMAALMMCAHIPMYLFINKNDASTIVIGATIGAWLGTFMVLGQYNGFLRTLTIHITFYSVVLALLGKYHWELRLLKRGIIENQK